MERHEAPSGPGRSRRAAGGCDWRHELDDPLWRLLELGRPRLHDPRGRHGMEQETWALGRRPARSRRAELEAGAVAARLLGVAGAVVGLVAVVFLFFGNVLADAGDEAVAVREVREGRLPEAAYADVELGATKEDVLSALRPVLPVDTRVLDRYELRQPEAVAAECVYFDRADGRAGQQFRFCFAEDVLVEKTVVLAGDPGEGSAVVEDAELG